MRKHKAHYDVIDLRRHGSMKEFVPSKLLNFRTEVLAKHTESTVYEIYIYLCLFIFLLGSTVSVAEHPDSHDQRAESKTKGAFLGLSNGFTQNAQAVGYAPGRVSSS